MKQTSRPETIMKDAQTYFEEIVIPTINDFEQEPTSVRRAFLASVALFHTVDYLAAQSGFPNKGNLRKQLRAESPDFAIVDRVAHAFKHLQTGDEMSPDNKPLNVKAVIRIPPAFFDEAIIGQSYFDDERGGVEILNECGKDLLVVAKSAAEFLRGKIYDPPP